MITQCLKEKSNLNIAVWVQGNLSPNFFYFKAEHCAAYKKSMAEGSNLPSSVVSPSCPSKSVTVTVQSLTGQAAVLACQPMKSLPISAEAENADFWGPVTLNGGQTMLKTLSDPSHIPPSKSCCDLQPAAAACLWQRIRPIFFLVWIYTTLNAFGHT